MIVKYAIKKLYLLTFIFYFMNINVSFSNNHFSNELTSEFKLGSIKTSEAFLRYGPGKNFPIKWKFTKKNWPVKIFDKFDHWLKIETIDGSNGWMHKSQISSRKTSLTLIEDYLRKKPRIKSNKLANLNKNVHVKVLNCKIYWCKIELVNHRLKGWYIKRFLWGFNKTK